MSNTVVMDLGRRLIAALLGIMWSAVACAQSRAPSFAEYNHTVWATGDGAPGHVRRIAQTPDGWLWLGTPNGLYRFDGARFYPFSASNGMRLLSPRIWSLATQSNGDLYIGYEGPGLSLLHADGRLEHLAPATAASPVKGVNDVVRDDDGALLASTAAGLRRFEQGRWSTLTPAAGCPDGDSTIAFDRAGKLWGASRSQVFYYDRVARRCVPVTLAPLGSDTFKNAFAFTMTHDGRLWIAAEGYFALVSSPVPGIAARPGYPNRNSGTQALVDRAGNLWTLRCPTGVCLAAGAGATSGDRIDVAASVTSRLDQPGQLGSLAPQIMFEDREGDIWLGLSTGIERFRRNTLRPVRLPPIKGEFNVAPDADGSVWLVAPQERRGWRYDPASDSLTALPGKYRGATLAAGGTVVLLSEDGIRVRRGGLETQVPLPGPLPVAAWARSDGERVWLGGRNVPVQLWGGRAWRPLADLPSAEFVYSAPGQRGQMWRGLADGRLLLFEGGRVRTEYDAPALRALGEMTCVSATPELFVGGEAGAAVLHEGRFQPLHAEHDVLRRVTGFFVGADGTRWLNGDSGLLRVAQADWRRAVDQGAPLRYELLDTRDGYTGTAAAVPSLRMVNGRLWVSTTDGIVELDLSRRGVSPLTPQPALLSVTGDDVAYPAIGLLRIAAGTTRLRFDFTAPALSRPERVVFSYRLDGVDRAWQTSLERSATYTGLAPGDYRFRVRAMNENGVWSESEQTLDLHVAPTMVQTVWFKLACVLAGVLLSWLGYRLRLRFLTRTLTERLNAQMEERERIARELHDTVLQTFQAFVLKVTTMLPAAEAPLGETLTRGLREAKAAIEEGREMVTALRAGDRPVPSLQDSLRMAAEQDAGPGQRFTLNCTGRARPLHPLVEKELYAIGREALRNAFRHAHAAGHEAIVEYGAHALVLTVRDDGRGIEAGAREKPGRWGLRGIEERARLIHADARLRTAPGAGTTWRIEIKAALAYADGGRRLRWPWRSGGRSAR